MLFNTKQLFKKIIAFTFQSKKNSFWIICVCLRINEASFQTNWMAGSLAFAFHLVLHLEINPLLNDNPLAGHGGMCL